ncbi:hypothetical protein E2C01_039495 [Portunus trituberculatus]|uniref:Uncharacterized protein n=1 Tax=Portunus trituberculatus TaxID=210409 RepID=A0A5B7FDT1_PORTR|nr:hypothetical protein [Portunus trituberculatus]
MRSEWRRGGHTEDRTRRQGSCTTTSHSQANQFPRGDTVDSTCSLEGMTMLSCGARRLLCFRLSRTFKRRLWLAPQCPPYHPLVYPDPFMGHPFSLVCLRNQTNHETWAVYILTTICPRAWVRWAEVQGEVGVRDGRRGSEGGSLSSEGTPLITPWCQ